MPRNPTSRTPLLRLSGMRRADAPGLGRTNPEVRRNVSRLRRLLTPKISRRRQPTEALMMMITEECHPEEMQAFATRRPADEGPTHYSSRRLARTVAFILLTRVPRPSSLGPLALPQRTRKGWGTLIGTAPLKPKNGLNGPPAAERMGHPNWNCPTQTKERLEWATRHERYSRLIHSANGLATNARRTSSVTKIG
jgi:hypothetical protein